MKIAYRTRTEVLIIGMGGAGIKAAIKASETGSSVLLVGQYALGRTGATFYPGTPGWGMQSIVHEGDSESNFYNEIIEAGAGMADPALARILAEQCTNAFHELESYGINFEKDPKGQYRSVIPCFGKRLRGGSARGIDKIRQALWLKLQQCQVTIRHGITVIQLIKHEGVICGALALDEHAELFVIEAKAVVLATGGACDLYTYALATPDVSGDGHILALDVGASLVNMEFIQFIPGIVWPVQKKLFQEKNLDTCPLLTNRFGEAVLEQYLPEHVSVSECLNERAKHGPFTTADISFYFDVALYEEIRKGHARSSGGIHLEYNPSVRTDDRWVIQSWLSWMDSMGVDPVSAGFDLVPHAQCFNGGILIDEQTQTGIPGLFAAGEVAGGPHGADRLGGAAIAATQVFGAIAGTESAQFAQKQSFSTVSDRQVLHRLSFEESNGRTFPQRPLTEIKTDIQNTMWRCGAIVRSQTRSDEGLAMIDEIRKTFHPLQYFGNIRERKESFRLNHMIRLAGILLDIMSQRSESRGPHYREDAPFMNPEQAQQILFRA